VERSDVPVSVWNAAWLQPSSACRLRKLQAERPQSTMMMPLIADGTDWAAAKEKRNADPMNQASPCYPRANTPRTA
jgi:hypothetical protein